MLETTFESTRYFTQDEFRAFLAQRPCDPASYELLNGRIVMTPPAWPHGESGVALTSLLYEAIRRSGIGRVFGPDQGFALPSGDILAPDAAVILKDRWDEAEPPEAGRFLRIVPNLAFEILSPATASKDRGEKRAIYERNGVSEYWIVDLEGRRLIRYVLEDGLYAALDEAGEGVALTSSIVPSLVLTIDELLP